MLDFMEWLFDLLEPVSAPLIWLMLIAALLAVSYGVSFAVSSMDNKE